MANRVDFHEKLRDDRARQGGSDRSFGLIFAAVFALIALWPLLDGDAIRWWAVVVAGAFLSIALLRASFLHPLNTAWMAFGQVLHAVVTPLIMAILFYLFVTPMGLVMRLLKRVPIPLAFEPQVKSYWIERQPPGPAPESMKNQF